MADHGDYFARVHAERHIVQRPQPRKGLAYTLNSKEQVIACAFCADWCHSHDRRSVGRQNRGGRRREGLRRTSLAPELREPLRQIRVARPPLGRIERDVLLCEELHDEFAVGLGTIEWLVAPLARPLVQ